MQTACQDIGFDPGNKFARPIRSAYVAADLGSGKEFRRIQRAPFSLSTAAEDLVCVQAKSRTPSVGCTLRSLTHNLALLPPRGQVRARWVHPPFTRTPALDDDKLGLLLIPFPYRVDENAFVSVGEHAGGGWGWFTARPTWLPLNTDRQKRSSFVTFVQDLVDRAREKGQRVNGVVFPELSLNYTQFLGLARALARDNGIDFLIAGVTHDQDHRHGNFVAIAPFFLLGRERTGTISGWEQTVLVREKHHRWKLNRSQIETYSLGLDPARSWWEDLNILSRSLDVLVYRGSSTLTTLICEDLARVDPCQAVVRAIGPNLLIALLMDGPQIGSRWPARYATVLADDPGTSVLSLTSFGLMARQNDLGQWPQSCAIGLWKDEAAGIKVLELPREADAISLQIRSVAKSENTLDGRSDGGSSHRWEYESHTGVTLEPAARPDWVRTGIGR